MIKDMSYTTISRVTDVWTVIRQSPELEEKVGCIALKRLFELEPKTRMVYGMPMDREITIEDIKKSGHHTHATRVMHMIDTVLSMLGPDFETLCEILGDLGRRHIKYDVKAQYIPFMGEAIRYAMEQVLEEDVFTAEVKEALCDVYEEVGGEVMKAIMA